MRMSELAIETRSSRSRLSHAVARLEERRWVERLDCPTDRRGQVARLTDAAGASALAGMRGVEVLERSDGTRLALFVDAWRAKVTARDNPDVMLEELPAGGS